MFSNSGKGLKTIAIVLFWVWVVIGESINIFQFIGALYDNSYAALSEVLDMFLIPLIAYVISMILNAIGEILENTKSIKENLLRLNGEPIPNENVYQQTNYGVNYNSPVYYPQAYPVQPKNIVDNKENQPQKSVQENSKEKLYKMAVAHMQTGNRINIERAIKDLELIRGYKDANELLEKCKKMI